MDSFKEIFESLMNEGKILQEKKLTVKDIPALKKEVQAAKDLHANLVSIVNYLNDARKWLDRSERTIKFPLTKTKYTKPLGAILNTLDKVTDKVEDYESKMDDYWSDAEDKLIDLEEEE